MGHVEHLKSRGYQPAVPMADKIEEWHGWYLAANAWYSSTESSSTDRRTYTVERLSIRPARMVCQEWASLLLNERTMVACDDERADDALQAFVTATRFFDTGQRLIERAFAYGTGAWALRVEGVIPGAPISPSARIVPQRFDARCIIPLTFDEDDCTECAFVSKTTVRGVTLTQLQMHLRTATGYAIETVCFDDKGKLVEVEGIAPLFETRSAQSTFALVRPGLDNPYWEYSPFGTSVFDDALGAVKLVDTAVDNMFRDIWLGQKMLFLDERMLETDSAGNVRVPRAKDQQLFRKAEIDSGSSGTKLIEEYNPDLRVDDNRQALATALEVLGARCGLGNDYFGLTGSIAAGGGGLKTATEVVSEQSDLFRNVRKHENALAPAIARILAGALALTRMVTGADIPEVEPGDIRVIFDDSVIEDTDAQRKRDLADVAAQAMQLWEYRAKWYGEDEATARAMTEGDALPPAE